MARYCEKCGLKLSLFHRAKLCPKCSGARKIRLDQIKQKLINMDGVDDEDMDKLQSEYSKAELLDLWASVYKTFESDRELDQEELRILELIMRASGLSESDVGYSHLVRPYVYALGIREGNLPQVCVPDLSDTQIILKRGEIAHFMEPAVLKETRRVSLGYSGGSQGVSIRVTRGVRFRVGAHRGKLMSEERFLETSRGLVLLTNRRILLQPLGMNKPLNIPVNKVLSYQCFENGVQIYKEGREKGYFLELSSPSSAEVFGMSLGFLCAQIE